jgi:hypothetical protein
VLVTGVVGEAMRTCAHTCQMVPVWGQTDKKKRSDVGLLPTVGTHFYVQEQKRT